MQLLHLYDLDLQYIWAVWVHPGWVTRANMHLVYRWYMDNQRSSAETGLHSELWRFRMLTLFYLDLMGNLESAGIQTDVLFFNNDIFSSSSCIRWSALVWRETGYFTGCCDLEITEPKPIMHSGQERRPGTTTQQIYYSFLPFWKNFKVWSRC